MRGRFVIHEHHATRLHWDLRLEIEGALKSWAVPKGPSMNPRDYRLAVQVPDHILSYINFEGVIPEGSYGAGDVRVWDRGFFDSLRDPVTQLEQGKIVFTFYGEKLYGEFSLAKIVGEEKNWILAKSRDKFADREWQMESILLPKKLRK
jgi:bifunctional non-homologous end joining protein LigD